MRPLLTTVAVMLVFVVGMEVGMPTRVGAQYPSPYSPQPIAVSYYTPPIPVPVVSYYSPPPTTAAAPPTYFYSYSFSSAPTYSVPGGSLPSTLPVYYAPAASYYRPPVTSHTYYRGGLYRPSYYTENSYFTPLYFRY